MDEMGKMVAESPQRAEVVVVSSDTVRQIKLLGELGWGAKRIAAEVAVSRNTVRRYLRMGEVVLPLIQTRERRRKLDDVLAAEANDLLLKQAGGNAVVVRRLLGLQGVAVGLRTVQRVVQTARREHRRSQLATVRFETQPGEQMQIDFGQKLVQLGDQPGKTRVYFFVAVLGYSRRIFIRVSLNERIEEWQSGLAEAFQHFGGTPKQILIDNPKAMVLSHDVKTRKVVLNPAFAAFARDWGVDVRACAPYRARTKGKTENGVKYYKYNGLAELGFTSYGALETHTSAWMKMADARVHGTTHELPIARFLAAEKEALGPLPVRPLASRLRRLRRKVANDCLVNVDTVRYSVPHRYVSEIVDVQVGEDNVLIYSSETIIAQHKRCNDPNAVVKDDRHYDGLLRRAARSERVERDLATGAVQRSLTVYDDIINAGAHQ